MTSIYIDHNIFINYFNFKFNGEEIHKNISNLIDDLSNDGFLFPYSPAHVEEIELFRVSLRDDRSLWSEQLRVLGEISNKKSSISADVHPKEGHFVFYDTDLCHQNVKNPKGCCDGMRILSMDYNEGKSVADKFKFYQIVINKIVSQLESPVELPGDLTQMSEGGILSFIAMLEERLGIEKSIDFRKSGRLTEKQIDKIEKMDPYEVFDHDFVLDLLPEINGGWRLGFNQEYFGDDREVFYRRQSTLVWLFYFLNSIGYSKTHNKLKAKNRLHDTSHALYASYADVFVTNDKNLRKQTQAIFSFLKHPTLVMSQEEFIKNHG